jgi:glutathione S-transferase
MKLYFSPGACSLSPHIVAAEAGLSIETEKVDLKTHKTQSGEDFTRINPKGYVPALKLDDGRMLTEGPAIVQYLADQSPDSGLIPAQGDFGRYKVLEWLAFINGEIHKSFGTLFSKASEETQAAARDKIAKRLAYAGEQLGAQDYLTGGTFTVADAYLFVMLRWAEKKAIAVPDNLAALRARIAARPKVTDVIKTEEAA